MNGLYLATFWDFKFSTNIAVINRDTYSRLREGPDRSTWAFWGLLLLDEYFGNLIGTVYLKEF